MMTMMTLVVTGFRSFYDYIIFYRATANIPPAAETRSHLSVLSRVRRADPNFNGLSRGVRLGWW